VRTPLAGALSGTLLVLAACAREDRPPVSPVLPTATVRVQRIEARPHAASEEMVGTVRARLRAVLEAKISGRVEQMAAVPGRTVRRGTLLARIEAREVRARLDQAQAVRQHAQDDLRRAASLLKQNILPQSEYDAAQSRARVAEAGVEEAETLLGYTRIEAPFDGTVTRKYADVGDLAAPGKPLLEMEDGRALRLETDVPEAVVGTLRLGEVLPVRIDVLPTGLRGTVAEISPTGDPGSRTFLVKLDLPPHPALRAGQFGRVALPVGQTTALRVPASAVVQRGQMELVFVVEDGQARLRIVRTGRRFGEEVELVSGMEGGETLVVEDGSSLLDGQPLDIR
jgi:RND family efflux transporter MFP subunit